MAMLLGGYANIALITIQALVLVPLILRSVGPALYGAWLGSGNIIGWLGVLEMGSASIMIQRIASAHGRGNRLSVANYLATGVIAQIGLVILFVLGALVVAPFFPAWMSVSGQDARVLSSCFVIAAVANGLSILNNGVAGFAQAMQVTVFMNIASLLTTLLGFGTTVYFLLAGWGLWSIPVGLLIRNTVLVVGNVWHAVNLYKRRIGAPLRPSKRVFRDFASLAGPVFLANLGNAAMGKSDVALVAILIKPEIATVYALTRRAAEVIQMLLDRTGGAVFAGFAHLFGSGETEKAHRVYNEVLRKQFSLAVLLISTYFAFNGTFVSLWVGRSQFGGDMLNLLIGASIVLSSAGSMLGYLYGATGKIARSSFVILIEATVRFGLMVMLLWSLGILGLPLAAILTSLASGFVYLRWTRKELGAAFSFKRPSVGIELIIYPAIVVVGVVTGLNQSLHTWLGFVGWMSCFLLMGGASIVAFDPFFAPLRTSTWQQILSRVPVIRNEKKLRP